MRSWFRISALLLALSAFAALPTIATAEEAHDCPEAISCGPDTPCAGYLMYGDEGCICIGGYGFGWSFVEFSYCVYKVTYQDGTTGTVKLLL